MEPQKPEENKTIRRILIAAAVLCLACFAGGFSIAVLSQRAADGNTGELGKLEKIYSLLQNKWYYAKDHPDLSTELIENAISGMTILEDDAHTNYFSLEQAQAFSSSLAGSNVGIGVSFYPGENGEMVVRSVFVNSTADQAGIEPGDVIVQVQDQEAGSLESEDLVSYIKSFEGKNMDLKIVRDGSERTVTVTPGSYDTTVSVTNEDGYGIITLNSFSENSGTEFAEAARRVQAAGNKDLILDLRNNSGGYLSAAREIASTLLPEDSVIFLEETADGNRKELKTDGSFEQVPFEHIYILQNGGSASASEVLIGALQDNFGKDVVTTIGQTTYGKGTEQVSIPFSDGTSLKYTMAQWYTPDGTSINLKGFEPDVPVELEDVQTVRYAGMEDESFKGDEVHPNAKAVQIYLNYLGYPVTRQDEYFAPASAQALKRFEADAGLEADGIVDQETLDALVKAVGAKMNAAGADGDPDLKKAMELAAE